MFPVDGRVTSYWNYLYLVRKKRSIDEIFFHSKKLMEAQSELHGMWFVIMCNILQNIFFSLKLIKINLYCSIIIYS